MIVLAACGGPVRQPSFLMSPMTMGRYDSNLNCVWNVVAPAEHVSHSVKGLAVRVKWWSSDSCRVVNAENA